MIHKEALEDIRDLGFNYDGFDSVEGLKSVIDDMRHIAVRALKNKKWYSTTDHAITPIASDDSCKHLNDCKWIEQKGCGGCDYYESR